MHMPSVDERQDAIAVKLRLVYPVGALEHFTGECRQHGLVGFSQWRFLRAGDALGARRQVGGALRLCAVGQVLNSQTAQNGAILAGHLTLWVLETIATFQNKPLALDAVAARALQGPAALQLAAVEKHRQMSALQTLSRQLFGSPTVLE